MSYFDFPHTRTYDSDLGWLIREVKRIMLITDNLEEWKAEFQEAYEQLKAIYDDVISGNFPPGIVNAFNRWMEQHGLDIIGHLATMVFFGITDDGYFVAYIPEGWDDILFNTTEYDINIPGYTDFGHLVLSFMIGGN